MLKVLALCSFKSPLFSFFLFKCRQIFQELNFSTLYLISGEKRKFFCRVFTSCRKLHIRKFHVVVVYWMPKNCIKSVMHLQSCCFAPKINCSRCCFDVRAAVFVVVPCSYYAGQLLSVNENLISARFLSWSKAVPRRSLKWRSTYLVGVNTIPDWN